MTAAKLYSETTTSMQADPEVSHTSETASESFRRAFPISVARCAEEGPDLDWVPENERHMVPAEMVELCAGCPGRQQCLLWALSSGEPGYWAGTNSADRRQMLSIRQASVETADWIQAQKVAGDGPMKHAPGEGNLRTYRRLKCRCGECRLANADAKAAERQRAAERASAAA